MLELFTKNYVCMDSTHGLNAYQFELTTLLTLDELHQGFPVGFMFSNTVSTLTLTVFLESIKARIKHPIKSKVFMSDMADEFYNAWSKVMGPTDHQLFCTWHVDRAWRQNLPRVCFKIAFFNLTRGAL